jgi:hypothetical protein
MQDDRSLFPERQSIPSVTRDTVADARATVLSTRDRQVIRDWAVAMGAEPATGEASESGPSSSMKVADGGSGLRFNFPGFGRFRVISWDEWFDHFNRHDLTFVFEQSEDAAALTARYRLVRTEDLKSG